MGGRRFGVSGFLASVGLAVGVLFAAPVTFAVTMVSGDHDSNAPLLIDPSSDPDDPLVTTSTTTSQLVMFVQRMPVTKVVNQVTVGDLALGPGCATGSANAKIEEYNNREIGGAGGVFSSMGAKPISATPSKITWQFAPVVFRKDRGYAIKVSVFGCASFSQTTWAHNEAQVNPGQVVCAKGPQTWRRMWHQYGHDDRAPGCVDRPPGQGSFDPSMPTGWLVSHISQSGSGLWDVRKFTTSSSPVCYTHNYPNTYDAFGATSAYWRDNLSAPFDPEYTCRWKQWADWGEQPEHGWYYALPWLAERSGAPRDMYLKLDTIDYDALLAAHTPILRYDLDEDFHAISPGAATDFYDTSDDPDDADDANRLVDSFGAFASANPWVSFDEQIDTLSLAYLGSAYTGSGPRGGTPAMSTDYISERGDGTWGPFFSSDGFANDAAYMEALPGYANRIYGRVAHGEDGKMWLQYWFYYYFDSQGDFGQNVHEGDWEMVQVGLGAGNSPDTAAYSQHGDGERCTWPADVDVVNGHPVVYVAQGSHASYFRAGHYDDPDPDDDAGGQGIQVTSPVLVQIQAQSPSWVGWPGSWGDTDSPPGPAFQGSKWDDPSTWATGLHNCDVG
jgi:hypothetical protein